MHSGFTCERNESQNETCQLIIALERNTSSRYFITMHRALAALMLLTATPATPATAWTVTTERDRMTDRSILWAEVKSGDATLLVGCMNGRVEPRLTWSRRIGYGDVGVSYRFDDGPVIPRMAMVSQDGRTLYAWLGNPAAAVAKMRAARRVRVQLGQAFYDFDLTSGGAGLPASGWGC